MGIVTALRAIPLRIKSVWSGEASYRPGFGWSEFGNAFELERLDGTGFQRNLIPHGRAVGNVPAVRRAKLAYINPTITCPILHKRKLKDGGEEVVADSWQARLMARPNSYETDANFRGAVAEELVEYGNSLCTIEVDGRDVPVALHRVPHGHWGIHQEPATGAAFYSISRSGNPFVHEHIDQLRPARTVVHFRINNTRNPLQGVGMVQHAAEAAALSGVITRQQLRFMANARRPGGILAVPGQLTAAAIEQLRAAFASESRGGMPVLQGDAKWLPMEITSQDAETAVMARMAVADIARAMGVPAELLDVKEQGVGSALEALMRHFLSTSLGAFLNAIERELDRSLGMGMSDYFQFDEIELLRLSPLEKAQETRELVQAAVMSPNEARARYQLPPVAGGDNPLIQRQNVSLEFASQQRVEESAPAPAPASAPPAPADIGKSAVSAFHRALAARRSNNL